MPRWLNKLLPPAAALAILLLAPRGPARGGLPGLAAAGLEEEERASAFDEEPYRVRVLFCFSDDARLTPRLRAEVARRFQSHAAAYVGEAWQIDLEDASGRLGASSPASILHLTRGDVGPLAVGHDKVFVLGIRSGGDRFLLAAREFDVAFGRWGPVFQGAAREATQVARELLLLSSGMFSPLARLESGDARRVQIEIKGGRLPGLDPGAIDPAAKYKTVLRFVQKGALFRAMRPVLDADGEVSALTPLPWTFYEVEVLQGPLASCRVISALTNTLPPRSGDPRDPQLIAARTAGGSTELRLVHHTDGTPLAAMDIELLEPRGLSPIPLGTTDLDGRISIPPGREGPGLVTVFVRHGRDALARLPILPGAGEEPELALLPDPVRLEIEGRVAAVQEQVIDQVARRSVLEARIKSALEKKKWKEADDMLKMLRGAPTRDTMIGRLEEARQYAARLRGDKVRQTPKVLRMFSETELIIETYFNPDELADLIEGLEDELASEREAAAAASEEQAAPTPAASGATQPPPVANQTSS